MAPKLDTFTRQYLETALWSSSDESTPQGGEPLDRNYSIDDIAPESIMNAIAACVAFQKENRADLDATSGDDSQHGHDFWLTRNGHGAGFWDRGYGAVGERLSKACKAFGELNPIVGDDGLIHFE